MTKFTSNKDNDMRQIIDKLRVAKADSHKGQNGKVLIIGGSDLFHASVLWAAEVAAKMVDMVHVTSAAEINNKLMRYYLKQHFWNGIVISYREIESYVLEDDCILIGPGMTRTADTRIIVNKWLTKYPLKRWVIDGGALQMVNPDLLKEGMIITPHRKEWERLKGKIKEKGVIILLKGMTDTLFYRGKTITIAGGNAGLTKGGTGDVLAGLVAALAATNDSYKATLAASMIIKRTGEELFKVNGFGYNASDVVVKIPQVMREYME